MRYLAQQQAGLIFVTDKRVGHRSVYRCICLGWVATDCHPGHVSEVPIVGIDLGEKACG